MQFDLSDLERQLGVIEPSTLDAILEQITVAGFAVVSNLVSEKTCKLLMESVLEDIKRVRGTGHPTQHEKNTGPGHLQLGLRRYAPYVRADLIANPLIEAVVAHVLGSGAWLGFYNGNVNCPDSGFQPLHFDRPFSWKTQEEATLDGQVWPPPTTTLSCSIALEEITVSNGATEIYPGSQRATEVAEWASDRRLTDRPELLEKWGPPARMLIPAGGVCFRDPRMWHRGVPNRAKKARAMIAATYHSAKSKHWRGLYIRELNPWVTVRCAADPTLRMMDNGDLADGRLFFQSDVKEVFEDVPNLYGINRNARFVDAPGRVNHFLGAHEVGGARVANKARISPGGA